MTDSYRVPEVPRDVKAAWDQRAKRNLYGFSYKDVWREEHAHGFTVAKAMTADVLDDIKGEVEKAIKDGVPFDQFRKELEPRLQARGWWGKKKMVDPVTGETKLVQLGSPRRLKTIYWANTRTARSAGQWERAQRTKRALPYFVYGLGPSLNHREPHVKMTGTVAKVDDPIWDIWFPPSAWGCKCWVRQISGPEAESIGIKPPPKLPTRSWRNDRTGAVMELPEGVDPGWNTNPGKNRSVALTKTAREKLVKLSVPGDDKTGTTVLGPIARAKIETAMNIREQRDGLSRSLKAAGPAAGEDSPAFKARMERMLDEAYPISNERFPVGVLPQQAIDYLGAQDDLVLASMRTFASKEARAHKLADLFELPAFIENATVYVNAVQPSKVQLVGEVAGVRHFSVFSHQDDTLMVTFFIPRRKNYWTNQTTVRPGRDPNDVWVELK
ncbi:MAG: phage minor head protein [Pseudomonadota bacterium]